MTTTRKPPAKKPTPANARAPQQHGRHDELIKTQLARLGLILADAKRDVIPKMDLVKETFSERAAIREYVGGMHRETAENMAIRDTCEVLGVKYVET